MKLLPPHAPALTLLLSLLGFLLASPFVEHSPRAILLFYLLYTGMLLVAAYAVGTRSRAFWVAVFLGFGGIAMLWVGFVLSHQGMATTGMLTYVAFGFVVIGALLERVLNAERVDFDVLCTAVSIYLLLGVVWGVSYVAILELAPHSFGGRDLPSTGAAGSLLYFSFVTLTTLGYGDITPVGDFVRIWSALEAVTGVLFIATLVARLVSLYDRQRDRGHRRSDSSADAG